MDLPSVLIAFMVIALIFLFFSCPYPLHEQMLSLRFRSVIVQLTVDDCSDAVALPVAVSAFACTL